ncbi:carbohydrate ABC transporter permease [Paenibacillus sacheonensis]|uniref:ABC transporter permease subunit n=1 Tax=Paenibacillus sacheonensis TaxID=742054 RepID=A0A7X5BZE4_9BACL|nr:sugar ABC transporter permease [Paenibacillus sacheonensis]MBM7566655.1 multiple sugar transport system permease protein/raffinose/stachyose/melibiose transport system permease protein [Paenibacillus sacheonensis]NBC70637.1 ABC transporter permease subunit [Paenibacillus sacheonensis]
MERAADIDIPAVRSAGAEAVVRRRKRRLDADPIGYLLILPFYLFLLLFVLAPIGYNLFLSFTNYNLDTMHGVGINNYKALFYDRFFGIALKNTAIYAFFTLVLTVAFGQILAVFLNYKWGGIKWVRMSFFSPYVISMVAASMIWLWIYEPSHGVANTLLEAIGLNKVQWLQDTKWAMPAVIFTGFWKFLGYNVVIFLAGLQGISRDLYEAAAVDGAGGFRQYLKITIPQLMPVTFFLIVTGLINNFNVFEQIQIMTGGGPLNSTTTLVHQIYNRAFQEFLIGYAAAMSIVLLFLVALLTAANFWYGSRSHES